jgi:hypothetical protein
MNFAATVIFALISVAFASRTGRTEADTNPRSLKHRKMVASRHLTKVAIALEKRAKRSGRMDIDTVAGRTG